MSVSEQAAFGAAGNIVLNGTTYLLSKLTLEDVGKFQAWIDQQYPDPFARLRETFRLLDPGPPPDQPQPPKPSGPGKPISPEAKANHEVALASWKAELRRWEHDRASFEDERRCLLLNAQARKETGGTADKDFARAKSNSMEGLAYIIWLSISHNHPDMTLEAVIEGMKKMEMGEAARVADKVHSVDADVSETLDLKNS